MPIRDLASRFATLLRDERGGISGETLLYIPLFVAMLVVLSDARILYQKHAQMWTAARDAARGVARGTSDAAEAEQDVRRALSDFALPVDVAVGGNDVVIVEVRAEFGGESFFGVIGALASGFPARVVMRREPSMLDRLG